MKTPPSQNCHIQPDPVNLLGLTAWITLAGIISFVTLTLQFIPVQQASAATISGKSVSITLTAADFGLTSTQPHSSYDGSTTLSGGDISGTSIAMTEGTTSITRKDLLFFTYADTKSNRNVSATYSLTRPKLTVSGSTTSYVTISNVTQSKVTYSSSSKTYSGYANMTIDLSNTSRSGSYSTTGTTITINVTII